MFDFVPIHDYTHYFDIAVLCLIILSFWQCHVGSILKKDVAMLNAGFGFFAAMLIILYMGLRPVSGEFGDTVNYARGFNTFKHSAAPFAWKWEGEWLFNNLLNWFAKYSDIHKFFLLCAALYVGSLWMAMERIFKSYYYIPFLVIISMFTFWSYGVNGIRNGIGASLFILALTYVNNLQIAAALCLLSLGFHKSIVLLVSCAGLTWFVKNSYYYLAGWIVSVIVSYFAGERVQSYLSTLHLFSGDDKYSAYLTGSNQIGEIVQTSMVFRWDFLIYSAMGVLVGYYFIFRRDFKDEYYHWIYNTFLAANIFWVLVIRAAYSNRIVQLSWFIMPIVLIYPFIKERFWQNHEKILGYALVAFYAFTFYFNIIKGGK
jgi:uncharacterized membrane protein